MAIRENFSHADLERWFDANGVDEVECLVPDLTGVARGKILPRTRFTQDRGMRLAESVLGMTVTGEAPESRDYSAIISDNDIDMELRADPSTVTLVPWVPADTGCTAQIIHDCYFEDGRLVDFAPRSVLRRVIGLYADLGLQPVVAPELEFYLIAQNTDPDFALCPPVGRSGRAETSRQHYSIDAVNEFDPLFEDIYKWCELMGLEVDTLIHEMGAGQMEVNFLHGDPLDLADRVFYFKRTLREAALRHKMYATFMAKPMANEPGSAMHIHQSIVEARTGRNIFSAPDGSPTEAFGHYIGGLQKYMPGAMAFFAPYVNSYRRLVRNSGAPINIRWGRDNRTVGIRVPRSGPDGRRVENRVIGADANPYVATAVTLACGLLGMQQKIAPTDESTGSGYNSQHELPRTINDALARLEAASDLAGVLGERFVAIYRLVKELETDEFMKVISSWEREHLLLHV
jgi:glutamine synthetase